MIKKWFFRVIFILMLIFVAGVVGVLYLITTGQASSEPDLAGVKPVFNSRNNISSEIEQEIQSQITAKKTEIEHQLSRLNNQQRLLEEKKNDIKANINSELVKISDIFQTKVDDKQEAIGKEFTAYQKSKQEEFKEKVLVKKEFYENKIKEQASRIKEDLGGKLEKYGEEIRKKYYPDILNINLKLKLLNLSSEEHKKYQQQLADIKEEQDKLLEEKKDILQKEMQNKIGEIQEKYNQEFEHYKENLRDEIEKNIDQKKAADKKKLTDFVAEQQRLLDEQIKQKRHELRDRSAEDLNRQQELINTIKQEYNNLQSELLIMEKGRDRLR